VQKPSEVQKRSGVFDLAYLANKDSRPVLHSLILLPLGPLRQSQGVSEGP